MGLYKGERGFIVNYSQLFTAPALHGPGRTLVRDTIRWQLSYFRLSILL